jgi:hypothetical protein
MGLPHAAPKATEASAPEATEAATAAPCRIARTPTHRVHSHPAWCGGSSPRRRVAPSPGALPSLPTCQSIA